METKTKTPGNKRLYIGTAVFSLIWLFSSVIFSFTSRIDYSWDNFIVNLPETLSWVDWNADALSKTFLFGKYINKTTNPKITITAIDTLTLERYSFPMKRRYYGELVDKLTKLGIKSIIFDVILAEPDRDNPNNDRVYVEAVARSGKVGNLVYIDGETMKVKPPLKGLLKASAIIAQPHVELTQDKDGQIRRYMPFYKSDADFDGTPDTWKTYAEAGLKGLKCGEECVDIPIPSIGLAAYALYSGKSLSQLFLEYDSEKTLNYRYPSWRRMNPGWDKNEKNLICSAFKYISFADILSGKLSKEEKAALNGGITLVGSTAMGAYDHVPSPFMSQFPGVEVHATFVDNLLAGDFRRPLSVTYTTLLVLFLPWLPVLLRRYSLATLISVCLGVIGAMVILDIVLLSNCILMPFGSLVLALFLPFAYVTVSKGLAEGREKKWIKNTFGQYLSPKVVEIITKDPSKLMLGGEKRDMTAMFCDIAGFTTISEKLTPEQLTAMLNTYLSGLTDMILKHDGVVDKFIGDCIMAFWNAPVDLKNHRTNALLAAVDCLAVNNRLNAEAKDKGIQPNFRIGLNAGPMTVGNMGSKNRFSYTAIGDAVNLASRLEGANKFFHSRIMASEAVFEEAKDLLDARYLGQIRVVGKAIPVKVYEPFARKGEAPPEIAKMLQLYGAGIANFYSGKYSESAKDFKAALGARPEDGPSQFYFEQAEEYAKQPPKDWDGAFNLTSK